MKKITFSLMLMLSFGFNSLFAQAEGLMVYRAVLDYNHPGVFYNSDWEYFDNVTYNPQSGRYVTDKAHYGAGILDVVVVGSQLTAPRVGAGVYDLTLAHVFNCNMAGYSECKIYRYTSPRDMNGPVNAHATNVSPHSIYDMRYHIRVP